MTWRGAVQHFCYIVKSKASKLVGDTPRNWVGNTMVLDKMAVDMRADPVLY